MKTPLYESIYRAVYDFRSLGMDCDPDTLVLHPKDEMRLRMECGPQSYFMPSSKASQKEYLTVHFYGMDVITSTEMPEGQFSVSKRSRVTVY